MILKNQWPEPNWLDSVPAEEREAAKVRILLSLAAVYASVEGTASALALLLGVHHNSILQAKKRGKVSGELAVKIEEALGRECFPREAFRPDLFVISE
jgi:hypothetical protein